MINNKFINLSMFMLIFDVNYNTFTFIQKYICFLLISINNSTILSNVYT